MVEPRKIVAFESTAVAAGTELPATATPAESSAAKSATMVAAPTAKRHGADGPGGEAVDKGDEKPTKPGDAPSSAALEGSSSAVAAPAPSLLSSLIAELPTSAQAEAPACAPPSLAPAAAELLVEKVPCSDPDTIGPPDNDTLLSTFTAGLSAAINSARNELIGKAMLPAKFLGPLRSAFGTLAENVERRAADFSTGTTAYANHQLIESTAEHTAHFRKLAEALEQRMSEELAIQREQLEIWCAALQPRPGVCMHLRICVLAHSACCDCTSLTLATCQRDFFDHA